MMDTGKKTMDKVVKLVMVIGLLVVINWLGQQVFFRLDLTTEKRYTLSDKTQEFMKNLDSDLYVKVYLEGDLNSGFRRLSNASREMLEEFKSMGGRKMQFEFINTDEESGNKKKALLEELREYGFEPQTVFENAEDGRKIQSYVFPYAVVYYNDHTIGINLLENLVGMGGSENLNNSIESLEYKFTNAFRKLVSVEKPRIAFLEGHGELDEWNVLEATDALAEYYQVDRGQIGNDPSILDPYKAVIIAKPSQAFSEKDKFVLDQYMMNGGKLLFLIDAVNLTLDSLRGAAQTIGLYNDLNLNDQLFRYGIRVNPVVVEDIQAGRILMNAPRPNGKPQLVPVRWMYSPLLSASQTHAITRNISYVRGDFTCTIDTVGGDLNLERTVLLRTSKFTKLNQTPVYVNMADINKKPQEKQFNKPYQTVAMVQEGVFPSVFQNRRAPKELGFKGKIKQSSVPTRMMVVADGDIIRNNVRFRDTNPQVSKLGYDEGSNQVYGNKDFIVNAVNYLCDDDGWMELRGRHLTLRLLDKQKLAQGTIWWKWLNVGVPVVVVVLGSLVFIWFRRRKYGRR